MVVRNSSRLCRIRKRTQDLWTTARFFLKDETSSFDRSILSRLEGNTSSAMIRGKVQFACRSHSVIRRARARVGVTWTITSVSCPAVRPTEPPLEEICLRKKSSSPWSARRPVDEKVKAIRYGHWILGNYHRQSAPYTANERDEKILEEGSLLYTLAHINDEKAH